MCWACHQQIPKEETKRQYLASLENPQFEVWNGTSVSHLMLDVSGYNGYEISDLAFQLFRDYISWIEENNTNEPEAVQVLKETFELMSNAMKKLKDDGTTEEKLKNSIIEKMNH